MTILDDLSDASAVIVAVQILGRVMVGSLGNMSLRGYVAILGELWHFTLLEAMTTQNIVNVDVAGNSFGNSHF